MGDATYDAIVIGGGNKGLILAMYLARYGGMDVAIFERNHEAGGGWCDDEGAAPGFIDDYHATAVGAFYTMPVERDFPEWVELGGIYNAVEIGAGVIFKDDDSCIVTYNRVADPTQQKTAESIARFSQRDAETWLGRTQQLRRALMPALLEWVHNPPPSPGVPDAMERLLMDPNSGFDPSWALKTPLDVLRDIYESDAMISMLMRNVMSWGFFPDFIGWGFLPAILTPALITPRTGGAVGGTHTLAHCAVKIFLANGGKIFTKHEVDKVIIENGKATGVVLADGTQVKARKLVISTLDPYNLCFRLIGKEHLDWQLLRRVEHIETRYTGITWYTWALHETPNFTSASINPDINRMANLVIINKDPEYLVREQLMRRLGIMPHDLQLQVINHSLVDKLRVPKGKFSILTEQFVLPANAMNEAEWLEYKKLHADEVMDLLKAHTTNMSWDNVIGYVPLTPYDHCRLANMAPTGNWAVIDCLPNQIGRLRPIPELAQHRTPIENLYATGAAWHPYAGAHCWQGYNCYKIIAGDLGLNKPWDGHPW